MLGREPWWCGSAAKNSAAALAHKHLAAVGLDLDLDTPVEHLPLSQHQLVELVRGLMDTARVFLLDEPTSALPHAEASNLYQQIKNLRARDCAVLLISHKLDEMLTLGDRISVMRDGEIVWTTANRREADQTDIRRHILTAMVPTPSANLEPDTNRSQTDRPRFVIHGRDPTGLNKHVLDIYPGEIVGLAGLQGSGIRKILHGLVGDPSQKNAYTLESSGQLLKLKNPGHAKRNGVVLLTCDRKASGLVGTLGAIDNALLSALDRHSTLGWVHQQRSRAEATIVLEQAKIVAADLDAPVTKLSGGNQQKVYLARCLLAQPDLLLLDDPTRGVDLGAKRDLVALIRSHAQQGNCVLWTATELSELTDHCHRIAVVHRGLFVATFTPPYDLPKLVAATLGDTQQEVS